MNKEEPVNTFLEQYPTKKRQDPRSTEELVRQALAAADRDDDSYWEAVEVLWYRPSQETLAVGQQLGMSGSAAERALGANMLGQLGAGGQSDIFHEERLALLLSWLSQEQEPEVLSAVCSALGHLRDPRAVDPVARLKSHKDPDVRHSVVFGLLCQEDSKAIETLIELTMDSASDVRDWATFGLGTQVDADTSALREALVARLIDPDRDTHGEAMVGLARRKDERVIGPLIEEIESKDVGSLALDAAFEMGDSRLCPALLALKADIGDDEELERALQSCKCN